MSDNKKSCSECYRRMSDEECGDELPEERICEDCVKGYKCKICGCPGKDFEFSCLINSETGKHSDHTCRTCTKWQKDQKYLDTGEISTSMVGDAYCAVEFDQKELERDPRRKYMYTKLVAEMDELQKIVKEEFEPKFWFGKLKPMLADDSIKVNGFTGESEFFKVVAGTMIGRGMITISDKFAQSNKNCKYGGAYISLITEEASDKPRMGIQGLCATKDEAMRLLKDAMANWPEMKPEGVTIG